MPLLDHRLGHQEGIGDERVEAESRFQNVEEAVAVEILEFPAAGRHAGAEGEVAVGGVVVGFARFLGARGGSGRGPAGGEVAELVESGAGEGLSGAVGGFRPGGGVEVDDLVLGDLWNGGGLARWGIAGPLEADGAGVVAQRAIGPGPCQGDGGVDSVGATKGAGGGEIGGRIEPDHHQEAAGRQFVRGSELEIHSAPQAPVGEVFGFVSGIADLDVFEVILAGGIGVVHHLGEDDRPDLRSAVGAAEGSGGHGDEPVAAGPVRPAAEGVSGEGGREFDAVDKSDGPAGSVALEQPDVVAQRGESEGFTAGVGPLAAVVVEKSDRDGEGGVVEDGHFVGAIVSADSAVAGDGDDVTG